MRNLVLCWFCCFIFEFEAFSSVLTPFVLVSELSWHLGWVFNVWLLRKWNLTQWLSIIWDIPAWNSIHFLRSCEIQLCVFFYFLRFFLERRRKVKCMLSLLFGFDLRSTVICKFLSDFKGWSETGWGFYWLVFTYLLPRSTWWLLTASFTWNWDKYAT